LKEKIRSGSKADKLHKQKIVKEKLREQAEKDKGMYDSDQSTDNEFSNFKPPRSRASVAKSEITDDEPINDEPVSYRKKRKTCNGQVDTSKSDLFDYESLAKQENLILQLEIIGFRQLVVIILISEILGIFEGDCRWLWLFSSIISRERERHIRRQLELGTRLLLVSFRGEILESWFLLFVLG